MAEQQDTEVRRLRWRRINSLAGALALLIQANDGEEPSSASVLMGELRDALEEMQEKQGVFDA